MSSVSRIALGVTLALGGVGAFAAAPAAAQQAETASLNREERAALLALQTAIESRNYAAATAALATAQSAARSGYARYLASALQLRLGLETSNYGLQVTAIDSMISSGSAPAADLAQLYRNQGSLALNAGKYEKAETAFARWAELAPNDPEALVSLAEVKHSRKKTSEAIGLIDQAIALRLAAGQPVPESWYKRGANHAFAARLAPQTVKFSRQLVTAYPSPENWRDTLLTYRELTPNDPAAQLDALRLMRSTKALAGERDYMEMAQALNAGGLPGEAKAVLAEGVAAKMVDPGKATFKELIATSGKEATAKRAGLAGLQTKALAASAGEMALSTGDALFGYGDYAKAATLYRAAAEKGSVDAELAKTRLGMALALAGQKAEAEAALRSVTGPRADLASLWLLWLAQRG